MEITRSSSVTDDYAMAVSFNMSGSLVQGNSAAKHRRADLVWAGSTLQLVTLVGILA